MKITKYLLDKIWLMNEAEKTLPEFIIGSLKIKLIEIDREYDQCTLKLSILDDDMKEVLEFDEIKDSKWTAAVDESLTLSQIRMAFPVDIEL